MRRDTTPPLSSITRLVFQAICLSVGISMLWYALFGSGRYLQRQAGDAVLAIGAVGNRIHLCGSCSKKKARGIVRGFALVVLRRRVA
jgi:hypothetical protein